MKFTIFQESRIGKRRTNQDRTAYSYSRDALLMVLADGMGGHLHGEIAAQISVQYITQAFQRSATPGLVDPVFFLSRALTNAHNAIVDYAYDKKLPEAPRTTVVACVVQDGFAYWAHAGDSRLYLLRRGQVAARTRDHSRLQLMMDQGLIDADSAAEHPGRNRIYSCLGGSHSPQIEYSKPFALRDGDIIAMCSDGLWGPLGDEGMLVGMSSNNVMQDVPRLLDHAERMAGKTCDNLSMVAMQWQDDINANVNDAISTQAMALDNFTTRLDTFERARPGNAAADLTDDEIERAIAEINAAIQKYTK